MNFAHAVAHIPGELRRLPRWVGWRYEMRHGKRTKVPCCARSGWNARVDNEGR